MGLLQKAVETYDAHTALVGEVQEGHEVLAPVSHILTSAQIEITVNAAGELADARAVDKKEPKIIIPVTEDSGGRTSAPCAHPLCDQLCYLAPYDEKRHPLYLEQLEHWAASPYSHPMLPPILTYVRRGTILTDLATRSIIRLDAQGKAEKEKLLVRWRVIGIGEDSGACWESLSLFDAYIAWYAAQRAETGAALCMITGSYDVPAKQHPKGIIPFNGNAKLISANDSSNFTYRGRFTGDAQAATVGYIASQKAHNALRWLAAEQGARVVVRRAHLPLLEPAGNPGLPRSQPAPPGIRRNKAVGLQSSAAKNARRLPQRAAGAKMPASSSQRSTPQRPAASP